MKGNNKLTKQEKQEVIETMSEEQRYELMRIRSMKKALIVLLASASLFLLAFKYKEMYPIVGYLGTIPGVILGFSIIWFFKLMFKG